MPLDATNVRIVWAPQAGPQHSLVTCPYMEILFGGARGGGKTDGVLGKWAIKEERYGKQFNGVFFRKEMPQADDLVERAKEIYLPLGAEWREQPRQFRMPRGGRIRFRPLENAADAAKYQGQNLTDCAVEEAGNYEDPKPIDMLFGALRSKGGVPVQLILTANPGGVGQQWIKHRYIDPAPRGMKPLVRLLSNGAEHRYIYIPSRVQDNKILLANDPGYINRLHLVGSPDLVRAWLEGDWNVVAGAFFPEFDVLKHVVAPRSLPAYWQKFRSFDWGSARPFSVGWWAVSDGELAEFPRGAIVRYREWYGAKRDASGHTIPNTGLRLTAEEVADGIVEREKGDITGNRVMAGVADPSIFAEDGGPSIADRMASRKCFWRPADNSRVGKSGAMGGWDQVRARLKGDGERPAVYFFSTATDLIRTLPALQHDDGRPEDVDTDGEDHAADECFIGSTMVETARGSVPIASVRIGDMALTRVGYRPVTAVFSNGIRQVMNVHLSDGRILSGTPNHPVWVEGYGFKSLNDLRYAHIMRPCQRSLSLAIRSRNSLVSAITSVGTTIAIAANSCTELFGSTITALSRVVPTFITGITIGPTIRTPTYAALLRANTGLTMGACVQESQQLYWLNTHGLQQFNGTNLTPVGCGTSGTTNGIAQRFSTPALRQGVNNAAIRSSGLSSAVGSVRTHANQPTEEVLAQTSGQERVRHVASRSPPRVLRINSFALWPVHALAHTFGWLKNTCAAIANHLLQQVDPFPSIAPLVVVRLSTGNRQRVYNLSVEGEEEYFANGVLVHNCRYACMSRPYVAPLPEQEEDHDGYRRNWKGGKRARGSAMAA